MTGIYFFTVLEARGKKSRGWQVWFLLRACFLACSWLPSFSTLKRKTPVLLDEGPTHMTSLNPNCLFKGLISYTVILGVRASIQEFGRPQSSQQREKPAYFFPALSVSSHQYLMLLGAFSETCVIDLANKEKNYLLIETLQKVLKFSIKRGKFQK